MLRKLWKMKIMPEVTVALILIFFGFLGAVVIATAPKKPPTWLLTLSAVVLMLIFALIALFLRDSLKTTLEPTRGEERESKLRELAMNAGQYANKERLAHLVVRQLDEEVLSYKDKPNYPTMAFVIFNRSGFSKFVTSDTKSRLEEALTRLLANGDRDATVAFLRAIVEALPEPPAPPPLAA